MSKLLFYMRVNVKVMLTFILISNIVEVIIVKWRDREQGGYVDETLLQRIKGKQSQKQTK